MPKAADAVTDYWLAHYLSDLDLCSLCGNTGRVDTTATAVSAAGVRAGRVNFCICPNGQVMRAQVAGARRPKKAKDHA